MNKLKITDLKKKLSKKTKEELLKEITTLCQTFPQVREYYQAQGSSVQEIVKKYKQIIEKEFNEENTKGVPVPKARLSVGVKAVNDLKKLTNEPELIIEVMLIFVENLSRFNTQYSVGEEDYFVSAEDMYEEALTLIKKHNLTKKFQQKAYDIVEFATDGWGHKETLEDRYMEVYGDLQ
jgi:hypothetical protein